MLNRVSAVVRAYDPCLSCSTHADGTLAMEVRLIGAARRGAGPGGIGQAKRDLRARFAGVQ